MSELTELANWVEPLLNQISPTARKKLAKEIGMELRRSQQKRIKLQQNPDGTKYAKRLPQKDSIKRKAMFIKLKRAKHLKIKATADKVSIGFFGRIARIANVHQKGLRDRPHKKVRDVRYKKRELLGFTEQDRELILSKILDLN